MLLLWIRIPFILIHALCPGFFGHWLQCLLHLQKVIELQVVFVVVDGRD